MINNLVRAVTRDAVAPAVRGAHDGPARSVNMCKNLVVH